MGSDFTGWQKVECKVAEDSGYQVWVYLEHGSQQYFNITKLGDREPQTKAGYYSLSPLLKLKGIKG